MPKYTSAYSDFIKRLDEISSIQKMAKAIEKPFYSPPEINIYCRAGIVLLNSHIEGYFKDIITLVIDNIHEKKAKKDNLGKGFLYYMSLDLLQGYTDTNDPNKKYEILSSLFQRDGSIWNKDPTFQTRLEAERYTNKIQSIQCDKLYKWVNHLGCTSFKSQMKARLTSSYFPCENMINRISDLRNDIAHGGITNPITTSDLKPMVDLSKKFCCASDTVIANWAKNVGCPIR
ncbi:MAE_28990/MAE_18760 family HEPN-like nuclease [Micavibrio aeruginosavorus]|uniref:MAE_28990/MAE_18760 family HEPN-like nuclease n=1 Tax=Micavibrio aeruginosavorus TaxID=349221 RepID=UPI00059F2930|nr:MAE_28990/MAE_18760 family HEPN-like nuclease [Micavibrio aeruginosavorus]